MAREPAGEDRGFRYPQDDPPTYGGRAPLGASVASAVTFLAGVWLVLSPFVFDYVPVADGVGAYSNNIIVGGVVAVLAVARTLAPLDLVWFSVVNAALGAWLVLAPFLLSYNDVTAPASTGSTVTAGIVVVVMAAVSAVTTRRHRAKREATIPR